MPISAEQLQQLADLPKILEELNTTKLQLAGQVSNLHESQVDRKLAEMVAKGIPPVMCEKLRPVLLTHGGGAMVKLADGSEKLLGDVLLESLDALPKEHRINLAQVGFQTSQQGGLTAKELYGDVVPELRKQAT